MLRLFLLILFIIPCFFSSPAFAKVLTADTQWSGRVELDDDILVPAGVTLSIAPGTVIVVQASESTKTEPEYLSSLAEITVRGELKAPGTAQAPISFALAGEQKEAGEWAGILVDGGRIELSHCSIQQAESAVYLMRGQALLQDCVLERNRYGLICQSERSSVRLENGRISANDYGLLQLSGALVENQGLVVRDNRKKDAFQAASSDFVPAVPEYPEAEGRGALQVYKDETLLGTTVWRDRVRIDGVVRVPVDSRLVIMPGTVIEFSKRDTNRDNIGENGIWIMGVLYAKGEPDKPIIFRGTGEAHVMGGWDAINLINSDGALNLVEYCKIEDAYRGFHFHYSNVGLRNVVITNCLRGMQFQESLVELHDSHIFGNLSGIRARDSEILLAGNRIFRNNYGLNLFRVTGEIRDNAIVANLREGLRVREGEVTVAGNYLADNRQGLSVSNTLFGRFRQNVLVHNLETGLTLKGVDTVEVSGNFIQANGINGISLLDSQAVIKGNQISENGERGIGIQSFSGVISENNFSHNKLYDIGLDGREDVTAPLNWFDGADLAAAIYDKQDEAALGRIDYGTVSPAAFPFSWPRPEISADTTWSGEIHIPMHVELRLGASLKIRPGSVVKFAQEKGLVARGNIEAIGEKDRRIRFTALEKAEGVYWLQVNTEQARATFINCDFEHADMGIHSHFSEMRIIGCTFRHNESGIRFRGGPVEIRGCLFEDNNNGIVSYLSRGTIAENIITDNETGYFARAEKASGVIFERNNVFANRRYNLKVGDFNENVEIMAQNNWWGEIEPASKFYDGRNEPGIGIVRYEPFAREPFKLEAPGK